VERAVEAAVAEVGSVEEDSAVAEVTVAGSLDRNPIKYYILNNQLNKKR